MNGPTPGGRRATGAVLVTGGAGYIGSHVAHALADRGREVIVVDDLSAGSQSCVPAGAVFHRGCAGDAALLGDILGAGDVSAAMHFAGSVSADLSVRDPARFYRNNTLVTLTLAEQCVRHGVRGFVYSSSAAVYGEPDGDHVSEWAAVAPISPYGASKAMSERILADIAEAHPLFRPVCLRYFNVAGADPGGRAGPTNPAAVSLFRAAVETALGRRDHLEIFGDDYPTRDGACERDFIHISDLAQAHVLALQHLEAGGSALTLNCGYGRGHTVKEVVAALEGLIGRPLPVRPAPRRPGDPARSVADARRLRQVFDWRPRHDDLSDMLRTTLDWYAAH